MSKFNSYKLYSHFINNASDDRKKKFEKLDTDIKEIEENKLKKIFYVLDSIDSFCKYNEIDCTIYNTNLNKIGNNYLLFLEIIINYSILKDAIIGNLDEFKKFFIRVIEVALVIKDEKFDFVKEFFDEAKDFFQIIFEDKILERSNFYKEVILYKGQKQQPEIRLSNNLEKVYQTNSKMGRIGKTMNNKEISDNQENKRNLSKFLLYKNTSINKLRLVYRTIIGEKKTKPLGNNGIFKYNLVSLDSFNGKINDRIFSINSFIKSNNDTYDKSSEEILDLISSTKLSLSSNTSKVNNIKDDYNKLVEKNYKINEVQKKKIQKDKFKQNQIESLTSFAIAKKNLKLQSTYNIPPHQLIKEFLHYAYKADYEWNNKKLKKVIKQNKNKKQNQFPLELNLITLSILLGIHVSHIFNILIDNNDKNDIYLNGNKQLKIKLTTAYGTVADINSNVFEKSKKYILIDLPYFILEMINNTRLLFNEKFKNQEEITLDFLSGFLKILVRDFDYTISIKIEYLYLYSFYYLNEIKKGTNLSHLFLMNKNDNIHTQLAYLTTNTKLINYSLWIDELSKILAIDELIEDYKSFTIIPHLSEFSGSNKFIKANEFKEFLGSLSKIKFSEQSNSNDDLNIRMIYIRYLLSLLIATRNYTQSCSLYSFIQSEKKLFIQEKAKNQYIGKRIIPLSTLAYKTTKYFYYLKDKYSLNIFNPILIINDKVEELTQLKCLKWLDTKKEYLFKEYSENFYTYINSIIRKINFDFGRHVFESYAYNKFRTKQEYIDAFLNHSEIGTDDQAIYSNFNNETYTIESLKVINKIESDYLPHYSVILNEIINKGK